MYRSMLSRRDRGLLAAGSAVHLYGAPPHQKVGADQVMGVSSQEKDLSPLPLPSLKIFVALFPFWKLLGSCFDAAEH